MRLKKRLAISRVFYDLIQAYAPARIRSWLRTHVLSFEMCELIGLVGSCTSGLIILL